MAASVCRMRSSGIRQRSHQRHWRRFPQQESAWFEVSVAIWGADDGLADPNDPIFKRIEEETGVRLVPQNVTLDDSSQKIQLWATNGQLPDIFAG